MRRWVVNDPLGKSHQELDKWRFCSTVSLWTPMARPTFDSNLTVTRRAQHQSSVATWAHEPVGNKSQLTYFRLQRCCFHAFFIKDPLLLPFVWLYLQTQHTLWVVLTHSAKLVCHHSQADPTKCTMLPCGLHCLRCKTSWAKKSHNYSKQGAGSENIVMHTNGRRMGSLIERWSMQMCFLKANSM